MEEALEGITCQGTGLWEKRRISELSNSSDRNREPVPMKTIPTLHAQRSPEQANPHMSGILIHQTRPMTALGSSLVCCFLQLRRSTTYSRQCQTDYQTVPGNRRVVTGVLVVEMAADNKPERPPI